ncbi:urea ABC transporter permease subunit UrtB [Paenibacillus cymbidii]|uniref:urea ABC transporter permease subunit UrtB n=1 Tax=Paenibacillus cymbidii TaxID=1639034 RepID=UPI001080FF89|nr:urea ABC transporter permease subunit UrtB [Paenibacillus cymbidii]
MSTLIMQLFNGISLSSILLLIALGLAITFGLMNVINMAHGEFIMVGAYMAYMAQRFFQQAFPSEWFGFYYVAALGIAFAVSFAIGWLLEVTLIRRLYGRPLDSLLATWGVSLILQQLARITFGAPNVAVTAPSWLDGGWSVADGVILPYKRLFLLGLVIVCVVVIYSYLYRSAGGRRMRAVMQNRDMASALGISTRRLDAQAFAFGSGLAGIAGCALSLLGPIGPNVGTYYIVDAFMVVVLGGIGKIAGTVFGAIGIGVFNTAFEYSTTASLGKVLVFTLIIAFLQWRPAGLVTLKSRSLD